MSRIINNQIASLNALTSVVDAVFSTSNTTAAPFNGSTVSTTAYYVGDFPPCPSGAGSGAKELTVTFPPVHDSTFYYLTPGWCEFWKKQAPKIERELVQAFDGQFPNYPVSNLILEKDGTCVLEIAAIGFDKKEITVERNGETLTVSATHDTEEDEKDTKVYAHRKLSERNWTFKTTVPDIYDADKIKVSLDKGKLTLRIPLKEENKPVQKKYSIE